MSEIVEEESPTAVDGHALREQGRVARAQRAEERALHARSNRLFSERPTWLKGVAIGTAATLALLVLLVAVDVFSSLGRIHPGVRVGEVRVGAMTPKAAAARVDETFKPRLADPVSVVFEDQVWETQAEELSATLDSEALIAQAMAYGRSGSIGEKVITRAKLWFRAHTVPVAVETDEAALEAFLGEIEGAVAREPQDARIAIEGTEASLVPAVLGIGVRHPDVKTGILQAFASTDRQVELAVDFLPVRITDKDAEGALADVRAILAGPVTVTDESKKWEFSPAEVAKWVAFETKPVTTAAAAPTAETATAQSDDPVPPNGTTPETAEQWVLSAYISADEASATVRAKVGDLGTPPVDARFQVGGGNVSIVPSRDGVGVDVEALASDMKRVLTTEESRTVKLHTRRIEPELTTERAKQMGIKERIATFTTNYSPGNKPRVSNIHTLTKALDGTLIGPGETFSFNDTIGPRTAAKGYREAPAIVGGRLVPSLGGGICQVATTLFNTVFESGLPVVERRNHSYFISAYPKGRDATVSWGGVDFKFKNDTDNWVLIATGFSNSSVTISLYGTDPGYSVTGVTGEFTDIKPFTTKEIPDDTLAAGVRVVEDAGVDGRRIVVKRTVTKGGTVVREDSFTSSYVPKQQAVRVGTKVVSSDATATPTPAP
ncbi:MAG: VanW family protein [Coriobacteriia bacterium]|nr:VanW family protein [Coriobacteriia bacterium]